MSTQPLKNAIAATRSVLTGVASDHLNDSTPCAEWDVSGLINHIVGGQFFFASAVNGEKLDGDSPDFASGDFVSAFDEGAKQCIEAFESPDVMERMIELPFGTMPGSAFVGLAATDTFTHGWDLARATGQSTDLNPELAGYLLEGSKGAISDAIRNEQGSPFGFATEAPSGATKADELAAFLGRQV